MSVASTFKTIPVLGVVSLSVAHSAPVVNFINTKATETDQQPPLILNWPDQYPRSWRDPILSLKSVALIFWAVYFNKDLQ